MGTFSNVYPSSNQVSIFGPVYLPQVYARDLASLQIASSGAIDVVLNDAAAFALRESAGTTSLVAQTDVFAISAADSNAFVAVNSVDDTVYIKGSNIVLDGDLRIVKK